MKKLILYVATIFALTCAVSCKKDDKKVDYKSSIVGEWHCSPEAFDADVYVAFNAEGGFDLYQQIGEGRHRHYTGTYSIEGNTLSGTYTDGNPWGSTYSMEFVSDKEMKLTALNGSNEVMSYFKEDIPAEVRDNAVDTKSIEDVDCPVL